MNLKQHKIWVNWKDKKIPVMPSGAPASSVDPKTWSTYEEVTAKSNQIGFVIDPSLNLVAIDFDKCFVGKKFKDKKFEALYKKANTYTEYSPSKTGIHIVFVSSTAIELSASRSAKCPGFEVYNKGRYFTYTENIFESHDTIRTIAKAELLEILSLVGYPWVSSAVNKEVEKVEHRLEEKNILTRMFSSKNGASIQALYNGDISRYSDDQSAADMALCSHLAFWTQKDYELIKKIWVESPLGSRIKTQKREDYVRRTVDKAISSCSSVLEEKKAVKEVGLLATEKGVPYINAENVSRIVKNDPILSTSFRFNSFHSDYETKFEEKAWVPLQKVHIISVMTYFQRTFPYFERVPEKTIENGLLRVAYELKVNPAQEYFTSLVWDNVPRLDTWLCSAYGVENNRYHQAVGSNWLKGLAKRVMNPGCKFDYVLVLEGEQGMKKSTSLSVLGAPYHVETVMSPDSKDFFMVLARNMIVEFSEGETLARSEMKRLKAVITMLDDEFRIPYDRGITRVPRHCVFAMTTNQDEYLKDETGNRRWLPVHVEKVADISWVEDNRSQLLAEAYHRVMVLKETTWEFPAEAADEQRRRMVVDPYEDKVVNWFVSLKDEGKEIGVSVAQAYDSVYSLNRELNKSTAMTIASIFKNVLRLYKKRVMVDGVQTMRWFPSLETPNVSVLDKELIALTSQW